LPSALYPNIPPEKPSHRRCTNAVIFALTRRWAVSLVANQELVENRHVAVGFLDVGHV